jgi:hypothetical protein
MCLRSRRNSGRVFRAGGLTREETGYSKSDQGGVKSDMLTVGSTVARKAHMVTVKGWWLAATMALLMSASSPTSAQAPRVKTDQASAFIGTWVFKMTNPAGSQQTVRIWDREGTLAASVQVGRFPASDVTGLAKDGGMLVLSVSHEARPGLRENGQPIWAVIALTLDGDTMQIAQMLEQSETIKRGTGSKQP